MYFTHNLLVEYKQVEVEFESYWKCIKLFIEPFILFNNYY